MSNDKQLGLMHGMAAPTSLDDLQRLAKLMIASGFFQNAKDVAQACVKIMAGQELGLSPVASLQGIHFINGRLCYEAVVLASALRRRGYDYRAKEQTEQAAEIEFSRGGTVIGSSRFTMADAQQAGITGKDNWRKYPRNMLWARAMANGARWYCPDVFGGPVYVPEELGAETDDRGRPLREDTPPLSANAEVIDATPESPALESMLPAGTDDRTAALNAQLKGLQRKNGGAAFELED